MPKDMPPPEWFSNKDYRYLNKLDARGWLPVLKACLRKLQDAAKRDADEPTFKDEWGDILGEDVDALPGFVGPPVIAVVEKADLSTLHALEKPAMLVQVYLRATDSVIIEGFKKALSEERKKHPAPVVKRGPKAPNGSFDRLAFDRWQTNQIVQLADLIDWRSREKQTKRSREKQPKDADFGRWLFPKRGGEGYKLIHRARKTLDKAIDSIPALTIQVNSELAKSSPKLPTN